MNKIFLRKLDLADLAELQSISKVTFLETFSAQNSAGDMQLYLDSNFSTDKLKSELTDPESEFYFAALNEKPTAYLKVNLKATQEIPCMEIERIYVLKAFQGLKIGQILLNKAVEIARRNCVDFIWLGVWENNFKAIDFYTKNGFSPYDKHIFKLGDDAQTDILMRLETKN